VSGSPPKSVSGFWRGDLDQAEQIVARHHLPAVRQIIRAREAGERIIRTARENGVDLIVLGLPMDFGPVEGMEARILTVLLRRAPCEIIVDRVPLSP